MQTDQDEIKAPVNICDALGNLNPDARGWSRFPYHIGNLQGRWLRKKKWEYWCFTGPRYAFSLCVANVDYAGLSAIYLLEYESGRFAEKAAARLFSSHPEMPEPFGQKTEFQHRSLSLSLDPNDSGIHMEIDCPRFKGKKLHGHLDVQRAKDFESLNVLVPWDERTFQFTSKQCALPVGGSIHWGDEEFTFSPEDSFACLDYGRGIWPYQTTWTWAAFSTRSGNDVVGINMGAQWTDGTGANENGIILNGKLHKIFEDITITYDRSNFSAPWTMKTESSNAVDLTFTPFYEKRNRGFFIILDAQVHQQFGYYSGTLVADGRTIQIDKAVGWAEEHVARW